MLRGQSSPNSDGSFQEFGAWNDAKNFSYDKIHKPLVASDRYERIAFFGFEELVQEIQTPPRISNDDIRHRALVRLIRELIMLIDNTYFAMRATGSKEKMASYRLLLKKILDSCPALLCSRYDPSLKVDYLALKNKNAFYKVVEMVSKIKSKINFPLNENQLIFQSKEDFDPVSFKESISKRVINQG